jgi:lipopolysaccharide/colanic/teichoic acid biosynthesis glycosyltransferase
VRGCSYDPVKRLLDVLLGSLLLLGSLPVQALVALLVRRNLGSPVLFRQQRPGKDDKIFELVKFRSMRSVDGAAGLVTDEQRLTRFGSWLRASSLDELPTLWNVVKGDMSLVGPRPLLVAYLERYTPEQARRHHVRPGMTGLAQVGGRNEVEWSERFRLDVEYVDRRSLALDLKIILATVMLVVRRRGISGAGSQTMTEFGGEISPPDRTRDRRRYDPEVPSNGRGT